VFYRCRATGSYPLTGNDIRLARPNVPQPATIDRSTAQDFGYDIVAEIPKPPPSSAGRLFVEAAPAQPLDGSWAPGMDVGARTAAAPDRPRGGRPGSVHTRLTGRDPDRSTTTPAIVATWMASLVATGVITSAWSFATLRR
jgi:hypothetical protein